MRICLDFALRPNQQLNLTELAESVNGRLKLLSRLGHL